MRTDPAADKRDEVAIASRVPEPDDKIWFHKTASAVIDAGRCVGCGGCIAACPSRSISVGSDGKPTLTKMCTGCSACWDYCPVAGLRVERLQKLCADADPGDDEGMGDGAGPVLAAYSARAATPHRGQDGGFVTALLQELLAAGEIDAAIVSKREDAFRATTIIATTPEEIEHAAGSVYHQSEPLAVLNRPMPAGIRRIAYVGTPCQISVLRALQRYPWPLRDDAAPKVVLAIGLFCTRSFDPFELMKLLVERGEDVGRIERLDIREGKLSVRDADGTRRELGPIKRFRDASLKGCDECADFTGNLADLSVGNVGSDPGASTVLVRTEAGMKAWAIVEEHLGSRAIADLGSVWKMQDRNRDAAVAALSRDYDPYGPLWIRYGSHLEDYLDTDRAPQPAPPFRSHHFDVSC
ncbi:MAG: Coenzyme F420 hydrogenase/dehydrogenase, beta subunit C-terminal domain [Actinomycetota bacterium]